MTSHYTPKVKTALDDWWIVTECWKQRCALEQDSIVRWYERIWYTFKASICILVGSTKEDSFCSGPENWGERLVDVAVWGFRSEKGGLFNETPSYAASWEQVSVAKGSWHVHIFYNQNY